MKNLAAVVMMVFFMFLSSFSIFAPQIEADAITILNLNFFDESSFPPTSAYGANRLAGIPIEIYMLDDTLVTSGISNSSGMASFSLSEGSYKIVYGGEGAFGVATEIVDVFGASVSIDLYCLFVTYHTYMSPYELSYIDLSYIDLDVDSEGYQYEVTVQPGQQVNAEFSWWILEVQSTPVWYVSVFGNWSPTSALGNLAYGTASPSSHSLYTIPLEFAAPTAPGTYEIRLVGVLDYDWPNSFYTRYHYQPSLGRDTCMAVISKAADGPYGIGTLVVEEITVTKPVGGHSFQTEGYTVANPLTPYLVLIAVLAIGFTAVRRKTHRRTK
jgi:hypothetical protein